MCFYKKTCMVCSKDRDLEIHYTIYDSSSETITPFLKILIFTFFTQRKRKVDCLIIFEIVVLLYCTGL